MFGYVARVTRIRTALARPNNAVNATIKFRLSLLCTYACHCHTCFCEGFFNPFDSNGNRNAPPSSLLPVPNVTARPSTASVLVNVLLYDDPLLCGFNVAIKGLKGHSGAELHIYFLVHLESIYYEIFFYSKIVPNCAVAK